MNTLEKRLLSLQQTLEHLNAEVATLIALSAPETTVTTIPDTLPKQTVGTPSANSPKSVVGIHRYRQLQATSMS